MKILFIDKFNKTLKKDMESIPPIGSKVPMGYMPLPKVNDIILFPNLMENGRVSFTSGTNEILKDVDVLINLK